MSGRGSSPLEPGAVELMEEAVGLLREIPPGAYALYLAGIGPFLLGVLFFWAHVSWSPPPAGEMAWQALGLVALFLWMKCLQARFCGRLLAARLDTVPAPWTWDGMWKLGVAQARLQSWAAAALVIAVVTTVPAPWVYAYGQSASVIGDGEDLHGESLAQAKLWPTQNMTGLALISAVYLCLAVNIGAVFYLAPWLANRLLGLDNLFNMHGWSFFNTTFIASILAVSWAATDPLVKAFYVARVFRGRSLKSGEDLRLDLHRARRPGAAAAVFAAILIALAPLAAGAAPQAQSRPEAVAPAALDKAIDGVLSNGDFPWRIRPAPLAEAADQDSGPFSRFVAAGFHYLRGAITSLVETIVKIVNWFMSHFGPDNTAPSEGGAARALTVLRGFLYALAGLVVVALAWLVWAVVKRARSERSPVLAVAEAVALPDLASEDIQAAQLPADGWRALAREQMARGEWRLAQRALYLATLATLSVQGLVSLARFKTNLDYEREVRRRSLARTEIPTRFAARRREFEDSWYGLVPPSEDGVRRWLDELETPAAA
ncbi:MAG TPA: hypothetical protein VGG37_07540 [Opitutaceae bacterium]|jgi:hypothetical protein